MNTSTPNDDVIDLYEKLITLPYSALREIGEVQSSLSRIIQARPQDISAKVAFLKTLTMLGNAAEGIKLAEQIWRQGGKIASYVEETYMELLISLGMYDWCLNLALPKFEKDFDLEVIYPVIFNIAVGMGDLSLLERAAVKANLGTETETIKLFIKHQREAKLETHFAKQQQLINKILRGRQTGYEVLVETERGWPELEIGVFAGGDSVDRYQLQVEIDKTVREYYESENITPLDNVMTTVYDVKEHWAPIGPEA
ncbi:MAG: hypothetical protein AB7U85_10140 [Alphaproteobacteria bacterium]